MIDLETQLNGILRQYLSPMQVAKGLLQICPQDATQVYWVLQIAILENTHRISCIS